VEKRNERGKREKKLFHNQEKLWRELEKEFDK